MTAPAHYGPKAQKPVSAPKGRRGVTHQERMTNDPRRSIAELDAAILDVLKSGPLMKWEIRDQLQEPEFAIHRRLLALKAAKQLKTVGKRLDRRRWALLAWQSTARAAFNGAPSKPRSKAEPPKTPDSWWTKCAAPGTPFWRFAKAARKRDQQAGWTTHGDRTRPSAMEYRA